eukprot:682470-Lingulodinium_polyedra.AAC.1
MVRLRSLFAAAAVRILRASRASRERQKTVFAWCVRRAQNASRRGGERRSQPHHCATFCIIV